MAWLAPWLFGLVPLALSAEDCPALSTLGDGAATGRLGAPTRACLVATVTGTGPLADQLLASRLLIADAFASGARADWAGHVRHHLEHLDRDDADLATRYAAHLLATGAPADALAWTEHALSRSYVWDGRDDRDDRLHDALAVRTRAGLALLAATTEATPALERRALEGRVRLFAVAWLAHDQRARRDPTEALAACATAGWDAATCGERAAGLNAAP